MQAILDKLSKATINTKNKGQGKAFGRIFEIIFRISLITTITSLGLIVLYILFSGFKLFGSVSFSNFFLGLNWEPVSQKQFGILPMIITSFYITIASLLVSAPIGIACAVYAAELASGTYKISVQAAVQILAGTPSVVFGLIGLAVIAPWVQGLAQVPGLSILAAVIILSIMILPTIVSISQDVIQSVPKEMKEASLSLGATHFQTIMKVIVPIARPGITTAIVLALSRAFGEAMAVKMVIGNIQTMPNFSSEYWFGLLSPARTLTTNIIGDIEYAREGSHLQALFATGAVLFIVIMLVNYIAYLFKKFSVGVKA
ncbi:MAG: phosphate ABC transporter permease subunit PstC [Candidatus Caenarcaniphilales bacterium]|nr:phosphate ABC transporter permease subunit PstC [Candidatus Caenarcaniphilales bacterium]